MLNQQAKLKQQKLSSFPSDWYRKHVLIQKQREHDRKEGSPALWPIRDSYFKTKDGDRHSASLY